MSPEYSKTISEIRDALQPLGFGVIYDGDFLYVLESSGKFVVLEGEPHVRGAFNLSVASAWPQIPEKVFSVRLLMKVFGDDARPSIKNQLEFLTSHIAILFDHPGSYESRYRYLNGE